MGTTMLSQIHFSGPALYRVRAAVETSQSVAEVSARRLLKGPLRPGWNWFVEVVTRILQRQVNAAMQMPDIEEARRYLDSMVISSPALTQVDIRPLVHERFRGRWFSSKSEKPNVALLYLHGGGYSFYPRAYESFIAQVTLAANARTFALDYRLTPEHRFPAQLNDALDAYRWLLENGTGPSRLVVAGDSAGANLTLVLLLALREAKLDLPALAIALSPPTDFESEIVGNEEFDWINKAALLKWRDWYCDPAQRCDPLISPVRADLRGLPPIYMQAGRAEILYDSIQAFAHHAQRQGADVVLEGWKDMNHNFPVFGPDAPQSVDALRRIGEVIDVRVRGGKEMEAVSTAHG
jgi:epsilon-lactone hydrolase